MIGPGRRILEVGAGSGLATQEFVASGSDVVALEPGERLALLLEQRVPGACVVRGRLEDVALAQAGFDSVVAAASLHWVDLSVGLPRLHASLRSGGSLAVFRNIFGDDSIETEFRDRVSQIVARRGAGSGGIRSEQRPTMLELATDGWFRAVRTEQWKWTVELTTEQVTRLFRTFSDWTEPEVRARRAAADACGGCVTEHYQSVLHLLRRS